MNSHEDTGTSRLGTEGEIRAAIRIQSPDTGDTVGLAFTAAGTYDAALGPSGIEGQLYAAGTTTTVGGAMPGTLYPARQVWQVPVTAPSAGSYDLKVTLLGTANPVSQTVRGIKAETTPALVITQPAAVDQSARRLTVEITFAPGHTIQTVDVELQDGAGAWEVQQKGSVVTGLVSQRTRLPGQPGEAHVLIVTGTDSANNVITTRVGALNLT